MPLGLKRWEAKRTRTSFHVLLVLRVRDCGGLFEVWSVVSFGVCAQTPAKSKAQNPHNADALETAGIRDRHAEKIYTGGGSEIQHCESMPFSIGVFTSRFSNFVRRDLL